MGRLAIFGGKPYFTNHLQVIWPQIDNEDKKLVLNSLYGSNHSYGENCRLFEEEFASWNKSKFAINTNSGTAALHMCLAATGCGCGDEILVPAYSWSSTATVVLHQNCIPVFVDIDWRTCSIDHKLLNDVITVSTRAIIVAHLHGTPAHMEDIIKFANKYNLFVIEDACQSHGASIKGSKVGNWGHCAAFSFNQNKTISAGDAGMFVTNEKGLYDEARKFWSFGETRLPHLQRDYHSYALGWMYRSNDITAAFGRGQLRKADKYIDWQRTNALILTQLLKDCPSILVPEEPKDSFSTYSSYVIRINPYKALESELEQKRDLVVSALECEGLHGHIAVWQRYILPQMTVFKSKNAYGNGCPWTCVSPILKRIQPQAYPLSQKHCNSSFCLNTILRSKPNKSFINELAECILKVTNNLETLWKN